MKRSTFYGTVRRQIFSKTSLRVCLFLGFITSMIWWVLPFSVALPEKLLQAQPASPLFLAEDGTALRQLLSEDGQRVGRVLTYEEIPATLIEATLAAEDKRFFHHSGIDLTAIARAAWDNLTQRRVVSGASTLTQQLVKISADQNQRRTFFTKAVEALQARRLEMTWDKKRILTEYLNRISYGNLLTGCNSAAEGYLSKPLRDLTPAEGAFLAALPQAPTRLNPYRNKKAATKRQHYVLDRMHELAFLTDEAFELAQREKIVLQRFTGGFAAPHAIELAQNVKQPETSHVLQTTIQTKLQSRVEAIIHQRLNQLNGKHVTQAAAVVIENRTGCVLALVGSRDFFTSESGQINGAWSPHSPGSAIKPFTYLLALERGLTPASIFPDLPVEYATPTGIYRPENYDRRNYGPVTLRNALGSSLNIPAVRALKQIGGETVLYETLKKLGISTLDQPAGHYGLGLTIGNAPVRLLELTNAFACLARLGEYQTWQLIADDKPKENVTLFSPTSCYMIADILSDNQARLLTFGPHSIIRLPFPCAVKTGTSTNYRDNWTVGYTPEFTVGVWAGNFDNTPMNQVSGVTGAGPIFHDIFVSLHDTFGTSWFKEPENLQHAKIDPRNGYVIAENSPTVRVSRSEIFLPNTLPKIAMVNDYETSSGKAYLSTEYQTWIKHGTHWLSNLVAIRPESASQVALRITSPVSGSVFFLDPDLPENGSRLLLQTSTGQAAIWSSETLEITQEDDRHYVRLTPGKHEIVARSATSSDETRTTFEVRAPMTKLERLKQAVK